MIDAAYARELAKPMTAEDFSTALDLLGLRVADWARITGSSDRHIRRWVMGSHAVPGAHALALRLILERE